MKTMNRVLIALFLTGSALSGIAQNITYGVQAGLVLSDQFYQSDLDHELFDSSNQPRWSGAINVFVDVPLSPQISISAEPGFIQKGANFADFVNNYNMKYNYIQLPLLSNFHFLDIFTFSFGPEMAFMMSARSRYDGKNVDIGNIPSNKFELSGNAGIAVKINDSFQSGLRYNRGFTTIYKLYATDGNGVAISEQRIYNQYLQLFFRYGIGSKK